MRARLCFGLGVISLVGLAACGSSVSTPGGGAGPGGGGGATTSSSASSSSSSNSTSSSTSSSSTSASSSGLALPECTDSSQCILVDDCCDCVGIPASEAPPPCGLDECFAPACEAKGQASPMAMCSAGQCVAGLACDHTKVACASPPPACPPGQTPGVSGACWGACVPATECANVASCAQCGPDQACVKEITQIGAITHCVAVPPICEGKPSCACMGKATCVGGFGICQDEAPGVLACECPTC